MGPGAWGAYGLSETVRVPWVSKGPAATTQGVLMVMAHNECSVHTRASLKAQFYLFFIVAPLEFSR